MLFIDGKRVDGAGIRVDTELSEISENPIQNKVITQKVNSMERKISNISSGSGSGSGILSMTTEEYEAWKQSSDYDEYKVVAIIDDNYNTINDDIVSNDTTYSSSKITDLISESIGTGAGVSNIEIDDALSSTSENAIQNKVVNEALKNRAEKEHTHTKSEISDFPDSLPANGGNAATVNGYSVKSDVPEDAVFTDTTYNIATQSSNGLLSADDKTKLDGIQEGANNIVIANDLTTIATGFALDATQGKILKDSIDDLKKFVSDGKTKVANAITEKGVETATDATFDTIVENIKKIQTGGGLYGAIINVTTYDTSLFGKEVSLSKDGTVIKTTTIDNNGTCSFESVQEVGEYTINSNVTGNIATQIINVTADDIVSKANVSCYLELIRIVPFSSGTDDEIAAMMQAHYDNKIDIANYWSVGDKRTIHHNAMEATGVNEVHHADDYSYVIIGMEHDDLVTPINGHSKAAITLQTDRTLNTEMINDHVNAEDVEHEHGYINSTATNVGGWRDCNRRTWCNNVYMNCLPTYIQGMLKQVQKRSTIGGKSDLIEVTNDYAFLPSEIEVFGSTENSYEDEGTQYQYFNNAIENRYKKPIYESTYEKSYVSALWWLRSPHKANDDSFCSINRGGISTYTYATNDRGLAPCICI